MNATGYYILIKMDVVAKEKTTAGGIILETKDRERTQDACDTGVVVDIGPVAFTGYSGIDDKLPTLDRAKLWGVEVGSRIIYESYQGKSLKGLRANTEIERESNSLMRLIPDNQVLGVING